MMKCRERDFFPPEFDIQIDFCHGPTSQLEPSPSPHEFEKQLFFTAGSALK
jgi:hypothetical protein